MLLQDADDDARIGHASDFDVVQVICDIEALRESQFKRMHACTARMDEGAIDIEKEEALASGSYRASTAPNRVLSSKRSAVSVVGMPLTRMPLVESRSFSRYVSPTSCN